MRRTTPSGLVLATLSRGLRTAASIGRNIPDALYYRLAAINYRHRVLATEKRVRDGSFRSYELYDRHGNDWLLAALLDRCRDGECVIDVGANTGVYALSVACEYSSTTVAAIEPNPIIQEILRENVAVNGFEDRIQSFGIGLGVENASCPFYRSSYHELSSFDRVHAERWGARVVDCVDVPVRTLDSLVEEGEIPPPDHVKIDTEGFGLEVLEGARRTIESHRPFVYVEPHRNEGESDDETAIGMWDLLVELEYAIIPGEDGWVCVPEGSHA